MCLSKKGISNGKNFICVRLFSNFSAVILLLFFLYLVVFLNGCSLSTGNYSERYLRHIYSDGDILNSDSRELCRFEEMIADLEKVYVVYVGEQHSNVYHHKKQLEIIDALLEYNSDIIIGMEMFDYTYQDVLRSWTEGLLTETEFLRASHWYANWRFDFDLYKDILNYAKNLKLKVIGLNIPFHLPSKISTGGLGNLSDEDRKHLPLRIDLTRADHMEYLMSVYTKHCIPGLEDFDSFYEAQCVWEDSMAQNILDNPNGSKIVILVGNGHIVGRLGVPDRVSSISKQSFKTVYLASVGDKIEYSFADYIVFTASDKSKITKRRLRS